MTARKGQENHYIKIFKIQEYVTVHTVADCQQVFFTGRPLLLTMQIFAMHASEVIISNIFMSVQAPHAAHAITST